MLTIRLQRVGRVHQPDYRIVLAEKHRSVSKKAVEILGSYNPQSKNFAIKDEARLKYWISKHVEVSPTVWNLFVSKSLVEGKKIQAWRPKIKEKTEEAKALESKKAEDIKNTEPATPKEEKKAEEKNEGKSEEAKKKE